MNLEFDKSTHTYKIDNKKVPSVTQIINELLPMQYSPNDWYLQRGSAVHQCAAYIAKGINFDCDIRIAGQVDALFKFFKEVQPDILGIEEKVYSVQYRFAGTYDLWAMIDNKHCLIDYKSSISIEHIGLQLGGYSIAMEPVVFRGVGVQLKEDGKYNMTNIINLKNYRREFLALRTAYAIRERMGLNKKPEEK